MSNEQLSELTIDDVSVATDVKLKPVIQEEFTCELDSITNNFIFQCPHCKMFVEVGQNEINCAIFRHGYFYEKDANNNIILTSQMNPHTSKDICDQLFTEGKIYGCGKPFKLSRHGNTCTVQICDYI